MRGVVEEREPGPDFIAEIDSIEGRRALVEVVAVTPGIEAQERAEKQPDRAFVRDHEDLRAQDRRGQYPAKRAARQGR